MQVAMPFRFLAVLLLAVSASLLAAVPGPAADPEEHNRRVLELRRGDADYRARLRQELAEFRALPPARQERLRQLDHDLHEEDSATQARLWDVLERFAVWMEQLPESDARPIRAARGADERLQVVKKVRDRQFVERLPKKARDELLRLPEDRRPAEVARLKQEERKRRQEWQRPGEAAAARKARPAWMNDFPAEVQAFVTASLQPLLDAEERELLKNTEGNWPLFARTLGELADKHPVALPGPATGPTRMQDLPRPVAQRLRQDRPLMFRLQNAEGKWPDFALAVHEAARAKGLTLPQPLGPCKPGQFPGLVPFLRDKLGPALTADEQKRLAAAEGHWPDYPRALLELSRQHSLQMPGASLPGPQAVWDAARNALPELPDRVLRDFALYDLTAEERAELRLTPADPQGRERLRQEYFKRYPDELQRLRQLDLRKYLKKKKEKPA